MTRAEQRQFIKGRTLRQLTALRNLAQRFVDDPHMPEAAKQASRQKIEDIDAEIATPTTHKAGCGA